jgi:putative ABC transport system permease protein
MSALGRVVRSGVGRRRVQTVVIGLVVMIAVTSAVLGGSLVVASTAPFDRAFAQQHGPHLNAQFDAGKTTAARLSDSAHVAGVIAAAGPFATATITPRDTDGPNLQPMKVVGRADPGGGVDDLTLIQGTWVTGPGQIVLSAEYDVGPFPLSVVMRLPDLPGSPTLKVVGVARSVSRTADGWVTPAAVASLTGAGTSGGYQMLYRFAVADTAAQIDADRAAVLAVAGSEALTGAVSWLAVKLATDRSTALFLPLLIAFGVLGMVMSVLIVGNVIAGAVGLGTRRIGVLKALGFTPAQVVRAYVAQALIPAAVGIGVGVVVGNLLAIPVLSDTDQLYGTTTSGVAPWVDAAVVGGSLAVVALTGWIAALRAGRLRTVDALAVGRTPRPGRGQWAARLTARLPLPRALSLGLAHPFARPMRAAAMLAAIVFGAASVTFAVGVAASLNQVQVAKSHIAADVTVLPAGAEGLGGPTPSPPKAPTADNLAAVAAAIDAQPGSGRHYSFTTTEMAIAGTSGSARVSAFTGDASWGGYQIVSGSWFTRPGEAVVPTTFLTDTGTHVGDTIVLTDEGTTVRVRIVGEVFHPTDELMVFADAATFTAVTSGPQFVTYRIAVTPGTDVSGYLTGLNSTLEPLGFTAVVSEAGDSSTVLVLNALTTLLTLMLVAVAALGVLNMVVLDTRERVHDLGVHKALGMTPRQTIGMVIASVVLTGLAGGALGAPAGVALHGVVLPAMGHISGLKLPASVTDVFNPMELILLGLGGLLIAIVGALLPASWAARTRTATALRTE